MVHFLFCQSSKMSRRCRGSRPGRSVPANLVAMAQATDVGLNNLIECQMQGGKSDPNLGKTDCG